MIENILFILGAFVAARILGAVFNSIFERLFPEQSVDKVYKPSSITPRQPVGARRE